MISARVWPTAGPEGSSVKLIVTAIFKTTILWQPAARIQENKIADSAMGHASSARY
jgi:hypothetical protein